MASNMHIDQTSGASWCFPIRDLENDRVKLTPFVPSIHAEAFWNGVKDHQAVFTYLPFGPFPSLEAFLAYLNHRFLNDPKHLIFAILDKTASAPTSDSPTPLPLAGLAGYLDASPQNLSAEIGMLVCLPASQRKGTTASAVALLLQHALSLPADGGLGLRRLQYQADAGNAPSLALARKMGFRMEGVQRWQRVLGAHKPGNARGAGREGDPCPGTKGRDAVILAVCWDEWEEGVKAKVCVPGSVMLAPK